MAGKNISDHPLFLLTDRRAFLERVMDHLHASPDCRYIFKPWRSPTMEEEANWQARESIGAAMKFFPMTPDTPPKAEVEPEHDEPVDQPAEA